MRSRLWLAIPPIVYLLLPTRNYYWDGVAFAINAEKQLPLRDTLHPNHLLYTPAAAALYRGALWLGIHTRALFLMQGANSLLAAACVWLLYRALERRGFEASAAAAGALSLAFAATWWRYATDANPYIASIFLILAANECLEARGNSLAAGLIASAAMLFHQLAILFLPVALYRRPKGRWLFAAAALGPVAAIYVLAYRTVFGRFDTAGFLGWLVARSPDAGFSFQPLRNAALTATGTLRLFFGGRLDQMHPGVLTIAAAVALALIAYRLRRVAAMRVSPPPGDVVLWVGLYAAFLFFWMPQNTFYRLFYLPPLVLLLACAVRWPPARWVPALLFTWNLAFLIYPQSLVRNNAPLAFALTQHDRWPPGTPIAFHIFHPDLWTISYFNPQASWIGMETLDLAQLDRSLPLWLDSTEYDLLAGDERGRRWLAEHEVPAGKLAGGDARHEFRFYRAR